MTRSKLSWYQLSAPSVLTFFLEQQHQPKCPYIWAKWRLCIYSLEAPLAAKMIFFSPGNIFRERWMPQGRKTWAISQVGLMICPQSNSILVHIRTTAISDESEPSWLEPLLELKDFQNGSALLVTFFIQLETKNRLKTSRNFDFVF